MREVKKEKKGELEGEKKNRNTNVSGNHDDDGACGMWQSK